MAIDDIILRLEEQVDRMLDRQRTQESELRRLREENAELLAERDRFRSELDRILDKLDSLDGESS